MTSYVIRLVYEIHYESFFPRFLIVYLIVGNLFGFLIFFGRFVACAGQGFLLWGELLHQDQFVIHYIILRSN